jgi:hypothetical protein
MITTDPETAFLRHTIATLAYRGGKALSGAPNTFAEFSVGTDSRSPGEILAHVCDLLDWALTQVEGRQAWHDSDFVAWDEGIARFFAGLEMLDRRLAEGEPSGYPPTRIFQGAIADALTHIGQIAMLRRLAGSPVRGENYFQADIEAGRVGREQAPPRREFD